MNDSFAEILSCTTTACLCHQPSPATMNAPFTFTPHQNAPLIYAPISPMMNFSLLILFQQTCQWAFSLGTTDDIVAGNVSATTSGVVSIVVPNAHAANTSINTNKNPTSNDSHALC